MFVKHGEKMYLSPGLPHSEEYYSGIRTDLSCTHLNSNYGHMLKMVSLSCIHTKSTHAAHFTQLY